MAKKLKKFTPETLAATREKWSDSAKELDIPFLDYDVILGWSESHMGYANANGDSLAYGIFEGRSDFALAIVEIVYTQRSRGNWLKMLSVKLGPMLAPAVVEADMAKMSEVIDIYAEATIGTVELTGSHKAKTVKLYGRNENLLKLLLILNERLRSLAADKFACKMEGRWLVITGR